MPAKATTSRPISGATASASGSRLARRIGLPGAAADDRERRRFVAADHDQRLHVRRLRRERRAQGAGGNAEAVAEAALPVDHGEGEVLRQRRVLQAVVEHEDLGPRLDRHRRAPDAVRSDPARRDPREQQRLVADRPRVMDGRIDLDGIDPLHAAVAARKKRDPAALADQHPRERDRRRRLAGAAGDEIADADDRRARPSLRACAMRRATAAP